jgi:hypothetical protein
MIHLERVIVMIIGEIYSRKSYEYIIVGAVYHKNTGVPIYTIQKRKYGEDEVSYFLQDGDFESGYKFEGTLVAWQG